ncbi:glucuronate isomerase [Nostocaceae cyanobacterium CENA369]|uniref:Uronate isomerase n=1 Tax=Dendronalium phyllosphericum CENA369 TaxID=1725256 RepID=A0A8J7I5F1_9NOST|nr:glucuronate isomerase [Dendronalium phyllosphericum]MBH8573860.1 glucuronate isomerase [Dendronalium phyllosphericum CENA369]
MLTKKRSLSSDRCFDSEPIQRQLAHQFFDSISALPLICPHGHVDPALLANPAARFGSPTELFIIPDHYIFRMLYSRGIPLQALGIPTSDGSLIETNHRKIWQLFAENFYLFRGTPSGLWLKDELYNVFGVDEPLNSRNAADIYDYLEEQLTLPEFSPRALFKSFNIEVLCTTDAASDTLEHHQSLHQEGFTHIKPTFRPDAVVNLDAPGWRENLAKLESTVDWEISTYASFVQALEERRAFFKKMGATATDQSAATPYTMRLCDQEAEAIFARALAGKLNPGDAQRFIGHMFVEMARMSVEDGLVMQMHCGIARNHNPALFERFGADKGADMPVQIEWTENLRPLLEAYGNNRNFHLILFGLDESTYSRELAPLAGHYPAILLGPPWWFHDSVNGMERYFDQVMETAGLYNTAGFNDDTRAFVSIPARHTVWRRVACNWLAGLVARGLVEEEEGYEMAGALAYDLAKVAYKLD